MIQCTASPYSGVMEVVGITPNGDGVVQREMAGANPFVLRGGAAPITIGGFDLFDTEAPFGVDLTYRATVSNITSANRLIQQNLALTPTFLNGVQGWLAGTGRTLSVVADATAHSAAGVGKVTSTGTTTTPSAPGTLTGWKNSAVGVSGSYTLDPATPSGGAAIATNDWMLIIHFQLSSVAAPATPSGWTLLDNQSANGYRQMIWARKRQAGDTSYTVAAGSGASSVGSLNWVRGTGDIQTLSVTTLPDVPGSSTSLRTSTHAAIRPALVMSIFTATATIGQSSVAAARAHVIAAGGVGAGTPSANAVAHATIRAAGQGSGPLAGATPAYLLNSASSTQSLIVGTNSQTEAGDTAAVSANYGSPIGACFATQVAFHTADVLTNRTIARGKAALIPATTADKPHLLTGRFKFLHPGLWTWADVLAQGTWQNLKNTKATWLDVRGTSSTVPGNFLSLFMTITDGSGNDLIPPQKVLTGTDVAVNSWLDFSMLFANTVDIPTTAEIRLVHGSTLKEFGIEWYFDEIGITPGAQRVHPTLYWFSGSTPVPSDPEDLLMGDTAWSAVTSDASITWAGTVGNSVSEFRMASSITTTTTCRLDAPTDVPCEPILLSDPVNVTLSKWVSLVGIDDLSHPANRTISRVLKRSDAVALSQIRGDEETDIFVATDTLDDREQLLDVLRSGRAILIRNPDPRYPENNWYMSVGDVTEKRPILDHRRPERTWTLPVVRVARPTGLIEASGGVTWADVLALGAWSDVLADRDSWLEVLTGGD
jgi:hypothetical protein